MMIAAALAFMGIACFILGVIAGWTVRSLRRGPHTYR